MRRSDGQTRLGRAGWPLGLAVLIEACTTLSSTAAPTNSPSIPPASADSVVPSAVAIPSPSPTPNPTSSPSSTPTPTPTPRPTPTPVPEWNLDVPVLTYHVIAPRSVASSYALAGLDVDPSVFDAQLAHLRANGWRSITVDRLSRDLAAKRRPPAKTLVITIDDGHDDGYTYALPILRKYGFVATFYVVVGRVGEPHTLTWPEILALKAAGMEIGNHTMDHVNLTQVTADQVAYEIDQAQRVLAQHLGTAPTTFAYPFWAYDRAVVGVVRAAGLRMAMTLGSVPYEAESDRYSVPRLDLYSSLSAIELLAKIAPYG